MAEAKEQSTKHKAQKTKDNILSVASALFSDKGYEAATMDEIAAAAGISKATLYRYFSSKVALRDMVAPHLPDADLRARDARARILEAAIDLVGKQGFGRTSLEDIAVAAGVSKGAIYWHFKGKEDLFAAIIEDYSPIPQVLAVMADTEGLAVEEVIRRLYGIFLTFASQRTDFFRAVFSEIQVNPELGAIFGANALLPMFSVVGPYLMANMADAGLRPMSPVLLLQALMGPLVIHMLTRQMLQEQIGLEIPLDEARDTFLRIFFDGVREPGSRQQDSANLRMGDKDHV